MNLNGVSNIDIKLVKVEGISISLQLSKIILTRRKISHVEKKKALYLGRQTDPDTCNGELNTLT